MCIRDRSTETDNNDLIQSLVVFLHGYIDVTTDAYKRQIYGYL